MRRQRDKPAHPRLHDLLCHPESPFSHRRSGHSTGAPTHSQRPGATIHAPPPEERRSHTMPLVQAGDVRLEYDERGEGAPAFLLVHGYRSSHRIWDATQAALAGHGFRSVAISMRGAAGSDVTQADEDYSAFNFARDLHAAVDALGLERFVLVGHSMGASTVTNYVRDHADRVQALVLLAGGALAPRADMTPEQEAAWNARIEGYPGNIHRDYWEREHSGLSEEVRAALWEDWQRVPKPRLRGMRAMPQDLQSVIRSMSVPTLVVFGDQDHTVPPDGSVRCYLDLPREVRHLHVFHGVDHSPNAVIAERLAGVLTRFVQATVPATVATS
ncbi:MAG: alpha/beta fold hydrolase [Dehalococcoidia bacterium]|nr:alpha/beta fold hydrolase [Dehalococcoidia bacterium]